MGTILENKDRQDSPLCVDNCVKFRYKPLFTKLIPGAILTVSPTEKDIAAHMVYYFNICQGYHLGHYSTTI